MKNYLGAISLVVLWGSLVLFWVLANIRRNKSIKDYNKKRIESEFIKYEKRKGYTCKNCISFINDNYGTCGARDSMRHPSSETCPCFELKRRKSQNFD